MRIDIPAQIRKLAGAQLQGDWQLLAECIRFAAARGADRIDVRLGAGRLEIEIEGARFEPEVAEAAVQLRQAGEDPARAQAALLLLEAKAALPLLVIAGTPRLSCELVAPTREGALRLQIQGDGATSRPHAGHAPSIATWSISGLDFDRKRARVHTLDAVRFAAFRVTIDGVAPPPPFDDAIDVAALRIPAAQAPAPRSATLAPAPRSATLALPREGDAPRVWVTRHGVLAAHFTASRGPAFEVAFEVGDGLGPRATAADLRAYGQALLPSTMTAFVERLHTAAASTRSATDRQRLALLTLQGAAFPEHARPLAAIPVFDALDASGQPTPESLVELRARVRSVRGRRRLAALHPEERPEDYELGAGAVLLDDALRARLSRQLDLDIGPPPLRPRGLTSKARWQRRRRGIIDRFEAWTRPLRRRPTPIPPESLGPDELRLLDALALVCGPQREVRFCAGTGPNRWTRDTLWLSRDRPEVAASAALCADEASWAYVAALALFEGREPAQALRARWRPSSWMRLR